MSDLSLVSVVSCDCWQVDTFGSADPFVCVSAFAVSGFTGNVMHDAKAKEAYISKSGVWRMNPQVSTCYPEISGGLSVTSIKYAK